MTDNNGWPDSARPGVPLNPEREGHHWILTPDGEDAVYLWRPAGECERGRWPSEWIHDVDDWEPREGIYLGPCLTLAEVDALRANLEAIVIPTTYYMDPPDGGDVSIAEQVRRMYRHVCDLQAENARLREALILARIAVSHACELSDRILYTQDLRRIDAALGETQ